MKMEHFYLGGGGGIKVSWTPVSALVFHTLDLKKTPEMGLSNCEKVGV